MLKTLLNNINYRTGFFLVLGALIVSLAKHVSTTHTVSKDLLKPTLEQVSSYVDENGKLSATITQKEADIKQLSTTVDSITRVNKYLAIQAKNIHVVESIRQVVDTVIIDTSKVIFKDKDTVYSATKRDQWVNITAAISKDTGIISLSLSDTLNRFQITKNTLFKTEHIVVISHKSPYFRTTEGYSFIIKERTPKVTIGPYIGYGYTNDGLKPSVGISVQFPVIKIK